MAHRRPSVRERSGEAWPRAVPPKALKGLNLAQFAIADVGHPQLAGLGAPAGSCVWTRAANARIVEYSNNAVTGKFRSHRSRICSCSATRSSEVPPRSKKSVSRSTSARFSSRAQMPASVASTSLAGCFSLASAPNEAGGTGSALRSILPLGVNGSSMTSRLGIM